MSKYKLILFDLDGTLMDTSEGVICALKQTIKELNWQMLSDDEMMTFIGPPIPDSFSNRFGVKGKELQHAVAVFRDIYSTKFLFTAKPYEGVFEALNFCSNNNIKTAVATYKREDYAITLLEHFGFTNYTNNIYGADAFNVLKKKDIINKCIEKAGVNKQQCIIAGDTLNDERGAYEAGIDFIAVTYGFGYKNELPQHAVAVIDNIKEIIKIL